MNRGLQTQTAPGWWVHADGRVWGPYAENRLKSFMTEGRLSRSTMVGQSDAGPFVPAGLQEDLWRLFAEAESAFPPVMPEPKPTAPRPPAPSTPGPERVFTPIPTDVQAFYGLEETPPAQRVASEPAPSAAVNRPLHSGASRPLLVFAILRSLGAVAFETVLAQHGPYERVGEGLWLIRARLGPSALRNALSRRMRQDDALLVVEADLEKAAWFNLDLAEERRLRALWAL